MTPAQLHALRIALSVGGGSFVTGWSRVEYNGATRRVWISPTAAVHVLRAGYVQLVERAPNERGHRKYVVTEAGRKACESRGVTCDCGRPIFHVEASMCEHCERATS